MKLIDQFIGELIELKGYKSKYESQKKAKKIMSDERMMANE